MKAPDTTLMPFFILIICSAGRSTLLVAFIAPATSPSASPFLTIKAARYKGSLIFLSASSMVIPLFLRSSYRSSTYFCLFGFVASSKKIALSIFSRPKPAAWSFICCLLPNRITSANPSLNITSAARRVRDSNDSGSTIRLLLALALANNPSKNSITLIVLFCDTKL